MGSVGELQLLRGLGEDHNPDHMPLTPSPPRLRFPVSFCLNSHITGFRGGGPPSATVINS